MLNLYSDYLISAFGQTTATGFSALLNGEINHDSVQWFLAEERKTSADLWRTLKPYVREIESEDGVIIVDDSICEKPYTDENEIVCWHYDHSQQPNMRGINFVTCLYHDTGMPLPVGCEVITKTEHYTDPKDGNAKRRSPKTKNEYYRAMTQQALRNQIKFKYVLNDVWFSSAENMKFVKLTQRRWCHRHFVFGDDMATLYQKRWNVEPYHKLLKQNASQEKSPPQTVTTRINHLFASLCGFVKLNHFALKSKLYLHALQSAYVTLREFHPVSLAA